MDELDGVEICLNGISTEHSNHDTNTAVSDGDGITCKVKVCYDKGLGRYLAATNDIKDGEIVLKEEPLIWGPAQNTVPLCLGCGVVITESNCTPCSKCGWPMCSSECEDAPGHVAECYYTIQRGNQVSIKSFQVDHPSYQCITVLRCLYQKEFDQKVWDQLTVLESHCEERQHNPRYEIERKYIAKFIRKFFNLEGAFNEEEILRVCGIVAINAHEVPLTSPPHVAIYGTASLLEHSCRANCYKTFTDEGEILIVAGEDIKEGDHITICYTDPLWGTYNRRNDLSESKYFWCSCKRCVDPTEFGTYFSSLKCQIGECTGYLLPETFISDSSCWTCNTCEGSRSAKSVQTVIERIGHDLEAMEKYNPKSCKMFLDYYGKHLSQYHFYLTDVRLALLQIIGQSSKQGMSSVSDFDLQEKAKLCEEVHGLMKVMVPAEKRLRGVLLYEHYIALAELGRRNCSSMDVAPQIFQSFVVKSREVLEEVVKMLQHEPNKLQEGKIYSEAKVTLENWNSVFKNVENSLQSEI